MLKNMKIGPKLLIICTALGVIPLAVVTFVTVEKAGRQSLTRVENELLASRSKDIAQVIDAAFRAEQRIAAILAAHPAVRRAAEAGRPEFLEDASGELRRFAGTQGIAENLQVSVLLAADGTVRAASDDSYLGAPSLADRDYFRDALSGKQNAGAAALNKVTGQPFVPVAAPVYAESGERIVGVLANILDIGFVETLIGNAHVGATGHAFVLDRTGLIIAHPDKRLVFKVNATRLEGIAEYARKMVAGQNGVDSYVFQGAAKTCGYAPVAATGWSVGLTLPDSEYLAPLSAMRNSAILVMAATIAVGVLMLVAFVRSLTRPIAQAVGYAQAVAEGNFTRRLSVDRSDEMGVLTNTLNRMAGSLGEMVLQVRQNAEQVASSSEQLSSSAQQLAEGAQSQASTLEQTSASVQQLAASVEQVSQHAQSQAASVEESSSNTTQMQSSVQQVSKTLGEVSGSSAGKRQRGQRPTQGWPDHASQNPGSIPSA
jgi:methyl-accepting chemotaxis protein